MELIDETLTKLRAFDYIGLGSYVLPAPNGTYYVVGFMDLSGDGYYDSATEPVGEYGGNPVIVNGANKTNIDFTLYDPPP